MALAQLIVIDAINNGQISTRGRGRHQHTLGTGGQMLAGGFLRGEQTGTFKRNINAHFFPRQIGRITLGDDFNRLAADINAGFGGLHFYRKATMHTVILQHMRIGFDTAQIVNRNDIDILAATFDNPAQHQTTDTSKSVNGYIYCHVFSPRKSYSASRAAAAMASAVMPKCWNN